MNKNLSAALTSMEDWEFFLLEQHVQVARMIRDTIAQNGIDEKSMAEILAIDADRMIEVLNASYPFDLKMVSKLNSYNQKTAADNAKMKIEAQSIGFAQYKDQYPFFLDRINKLLDKVEKNSKL